MWAGAPKLAQAKADRTYMEEFRKTLKATLMGESGEKAAVAQEREAYASPRYVEHLEALRAAVNDEELLKWRMVTDAAAIEVWRSTNASNRAMDRGTQ
jgi:hypothetical protein